jgi:neutral ceramidase
MLRSPVPETGSVCPMKKLLFLLIPLAVSTLWAETPAAPLRAGAATSNLTPPLGTLIVGGFAPYPAEHVHDELNARCLVLDDGKTKVALVVCDLLGIHRSVSVEARRLIQEATGIPPSHVMISATHTHSAGTALGTNRYSSDQPLDEYQRFVAQRIADGVRRAVNLLRPAEIAFGTAEAPEHVHNRRWHVRNAAPNHFGKVDRVRMNPPAGSPDLIEPAGPIDPTISFIALREPAGRLISVYSAYSLHYVGGTGSRHISADYYGMYCEALKRLQGVAASDSPPFVALMANGTSGDVNNIDFRTAARVRKAPYQQMRDVAEDVASKVHAALTRLDWKDRAELAARFREPGIAWRPIDQELLTWAAGVEAKAPRLPKGDIPVGAKWATTPNFVQALSYAGRVQLLAQAQPPAKIPLQVLRIGDIGIGSFPCETFAETGLEFKQRSPLRHSFLVSLGHGYFGYLPTPRHFELGGYETWPGTNFLEPQASVKMLNALVEMAGETQK